MSINDNPETEVGWDCRDGCNCQSNSPPNNIENDNIYALGSFLEESYLSRYLAECTMVETQQDIKDLRNEIQSETNLTDDQKKIFFDFLKQRNDRLKRDDTFKKISVFFACIFLICCILMCFIIVFLVIYFD